MSQLDTTLRRLVGYNLRRANVAVMSGVERVLQGHGLRRATFSALQVTADHPGLRQSDLGAALAIEPPNMGRIIDELQSAGLIERRRAKADRRAYALHCTTLGVALVAAAGADLERYDRALTGALDPAAREALNHALVTVERMADLMMTEDDDAPASATS